MFYLFKKERRKRESDLPIGAMAATVLTVLSVLCVLSSCLIE